MRIAVWALFALLFLIDLGAALLGAVAGLVFGVGWVAALPFQLAARLLVILSRRITHGRAP